GASRGRRPDELLWLRAALFQGKHLAGLESFHRRLGLARYFPVALRARHALGPLLQPRVREGGPDAHLEFVALRSNGTLRQRLVSALKVHRQDIDPASERQVADRRLEVQKFASGRPRSLREDQQIVTLFERFAGEPQRFAK